jgi:predicted branched-subunit amino acid permease
VQRLNYATICASEIRISTAQLTPHDARKLGIRDALGVPAAVLAAGMLGFGALALESGLNLALAIACTAGIWALPGQIVLIEMHMSGAPGALTVLAVMLTGARFLPMAVSLMPVMRDRRYSRTTVYTAAQLLAMTSWAWTMRRCADMPREARLAYFIGFAGACWVVGVIATAVGYFMAGSFSPLMRMGFIFLNPVYFVVLLIGDARTPLAIASLIGGAIAGPLLHLLNPQWSVLLGGVVGGTAAYFVERALRHAKARRHA